MKTKIFDQICFKRTEILRQFKYIGEDQVWQFIECDVALLLKEREVYRKLLNRARELMFTGQTDGLWCEINSILEEDT